jgi:signal peptidase I
MHEAKETAIALLLALVIWFGAGFVLQTSSPLNAIVSCSMLPHIQRGDMVVLSGDRIQSPTLQVQSLAGIGDAQIMQNGQQVAQVKGSLYSHCAQNTVLPLCRQFVSSPETFVERQGPLSFGYESCGMVYPKTDERQSGPCVSWLEVNGKRYYENLSNDVVVYQPQKEEYYARVGDIIHRAYAKLQAGNQTYILTKGDNNPVFDIQVYDEKLEMGNAPVDTSRFKGRVLLGIPVIGYLKLFISPAGIMTPEGCDRHYSKYDGS